MSPVREPYINFSVVNFILLLKDSECSISQTALYFIIKDNTCFCGEISLKNAGLRKVYFFFVFNLQFL